MLTRVLVASLLCLSCEVSPQRGFSRTECEAVAERVYVLATDEVAEQGGFPGDLLRDSVPSAEKRRLMDESVEECMKWRFSADYRECLIAAKAAPEFADCVERYKR